MSTAVSPQPSAFSQKDEAAGRAAYEAFVESARPWLPPNVDSWESQAAPIKLAWIAAAKAGRAVS